MKGPTKSITSAHTLLVCSVQCVALERPAHV